MGLLCAASLAGEKYAIGSPVDPKDPASEQVLHRRFSQVSDLAREVWAGVDPDLSPDLSNYFFNREFAGIPYGYATIGDHDVLLFGTNKRRMLGLHAIDVGALYQLSSPLTGMGENPIEVRTIRGRSSSGVPLTNPDIDTYGLALIIDENDNDGGVVGIGRGSQKGVYTIDQLPLDGPVPNACNPKTCEPLAIDVHLEIMQQGLELMQSNLLRQDPKGNNYKSGPGLLQYARHLFTGSEMRT